MKRINGKTTKGLLKLLLAAAGMLSFLMFSHGVLAASPTVITYSATNATQTSITLNGNFSTTGSAPVQVRFEYGTTPALGQSTSYQTFTTASSTFTDTIAITSGQTYYFRAMGITSGNMPGFGTVLSYNAPVYSIPTLNTYAATVGSTSVTLNGYFNGNGATTTTYFQYANNSSFIGAQQTSSVSQSSLSGTMTDTVSLSLLSPSTVYYFRAVGTNAGGTAKGNQLSFTTPASGGGGGSTCTINNFTVSPTSIVSSGTTQVTWSTSNCTNVTVTGAGLSASTISGSFPVPVSATTTFYITADNQTSQATVTVTNGGSGGTQCQITSFYANPSWINIGNTTTLYWTGTNCTYVTITGPGMTGGSYSGNSAATGAIYAGGTYYLTGYGSNGQTTTANTTVNLNTVNNNGGGNNGGGNNNGYNQCQITSFYASPSQVSVGNATMLYWNTTGCTSASISGGTLSSYNNQSLSGSVLTGALYGSTTYTISAYGGSNGSVTQQATVTTVPTSIFTGNTNPTYPSNPTPIYTQPTTIIRYITANPTAPITTGGNNLLLGSTVSGNGAGYVSGNNLAGLALWGGSIVPTSMIGILFIILLIMVIVIVARRISNPPVVRRTQAHH